MWLPWFEGARVRLHAAAISASFVTFQHPERPDRVYVPCYHVFMPHSAQESTASLIVFTGIRVLYPQWYKTNAETCAAENSFAHSMFESCTLTYDYLLVPPITSMRCFFSQKDRMSVFKFILDCLDMMNI